MLPLSCQELSVGHGVGCSLNLHFKGSPQLHKEAFGQIRREQAEQTQMPIIGLMGNSRTDIKWNAAEHMLSLALGAGVPAPRKEMRELDFLIFQVKLEICFLRENFCFFR